MATFSLCAPGTLKAQNGAGLLSTEGSYIAYPSSGNYDLLWADSSAHRWKMNNDNNSMSGLVVAAWPCSSAGCITIAGTGAVESPLPIGASNEFLQVLGLDSDDSYGMREAQQAVLYGNATGTTDGLGSQGLSVLDTSALNGCSMATSYWCDAFAAYNPLGSPLELQQLSLSDPFDSTCSPPLSPSGCGTPPSGDSGDLRIWLPFAVANDANVIELYYLDAALAFDPHYCRVFTSLGACVSGYDLTGSGTFLTSAQQGQFMNFVGQGTNCNPPVAGNGAGNCAYAAAINSAHGLKP